MKPPQTNQPCEVIKELNGYKWHLYGWGRFDLKENGGYEFSFEQVNLLQLGVIPEFVMEVSDGNDQSGESSKRDMGTVPVHPEESGSL